MANRHQCSSLTSPHGYQRGPTPRWRSLGGSGRTWPTWTSSWVNGWSRREEPEKSIGWIKRWLSNKKGNRVSNTVGMVQKTGPVKSGTRTDMKGIQQDRLDKLNEVFRVCSERLAELNQQVQGIPTSSSPDSSEKITVQRFSPGHESILLPGQDGPSAYETSAAQAVPSTVRAASAWDMVRPLTPPTHVPFEEQDIKKGKTSLRKRCLKM
ncbi:hypothetical protein DPEC_G00237870, partial [Dallia pectoralis]